MNKVWKYGKIIFIYICWDVNQSNISRQILLYRNNDTDNIFIYTFYRVFIALIGTNLNKKEKLFCVIAYLPKATVQSAKASIHFKWVS